MSIFLKGIAIVIVAIILSVSLPKSAKEFSIVLTLGISACLVLLACNFLDPIISTVKNLADVGDIDSSLLEILLKTSGVAILMEFAALICNDSGNAAIGKVVQLLGAAVILWLSLPLFTTLMDIINNVLVNS